MTCGATFKELRLTLEPHFATAGTTLRRLREVGMLPSGTVGRGGSAEITPRHAALALLGLASLAWCEPVDAPAAAQLLAEMRLLGNDSVTLWDTLCGELRAVAGGIANHEAAAWRIGRVSVVREGNPRLRFVTQGLPVGQLLANPQTIIAAELIVAVGGLFKPIGAAVEPVAAAAGGR